MLNFQIIKVKIMKNDINFVGIVTFHNAHNYGAVLQAYGLKRKLELMGVKTEFIQDKHNSVSKKYKLFPSFNIRTLPNYAKSLVYLVLNYKKKKARYDAFEYFINKFLPSYDLNNGKRNYSSIVLGSDQIWNFGITGGCKDIYFGINENIVTNKVISYAASMGKAMVKSNFTTEFKTKVGNLNKIGVREKSLGEMIKSEFDLEYFINLDPTLLLERSEWDKLSHNNYKNDDYLLVYEVEKNTNTNSVVKLIASKLGLKIKVIDSKFNKKSNDIVSPQDFISLFKNAKFVVTTSFHGTVFSIINEVPFYTIKFNNGIDVRSSSLLSSLGLENRHINSTEDVNDINIEYKPVSSKLNEMRYESEKYLLSSIYM